MRWVGIFELASVCVVGQLVLGIRKSSTVRIGAQRGREFGCEWERVDRVVTKAPVEDEGLDYPFWSELEHRAPRLGWVLPNHIQPTIHGATLHPWISMNNKDDVINNIQPPTTFIVESYRMRCQWLKSGTNIDLRPTRDRRCRFGSQKPTSSISLPQWVEWRKRTIRGRARLPGAFQKKKIHAKVKQR